MSKYLTLLIAATILLPVSPALSQRQPGNPGGAVDAQTLRHQSKADALYKAGDFERALFIYQNELAPIGDKYAQYMIGYMHLTGTGVDEDPIVASAWYRLAAERGTREFAIVRDKLIKGFDEADLHRSDEVYVALRKKYADIVLMIALVRKDFERLRATMTGSRIAANSSSVKMVDPRSANIVSSDAYYGEIRRRMQARLDNIADQLRIAAPGPDLDATDLSNLERQVMAHVEVVNDR